MAFSSCTLLLITFSSILLLSPQALGDFSILPKLPFNIPLISNSDSAPAAIPVAAQVPVSAPAPKASSEDQSITTQPITNPFSSVVPNPSAVDPVVKKICDVTENPDLCSNSIVPFMHGQADPVAVLKTEIHAALNITQRAVTVMKNMLEDATASSMMSECLGVCVENYGYAVDDLKQAMKAMEAHDMGLLKSVLSSVITDIGTCDDAFAETQGLELPLQEEVVGTMHKLANNCMDISTLLN
ncbi:pectinesterase inhibitor [Ziziphus jujuba]|uniref:Pectinesterase inhibitor n=2 Tax=Ziziphus jujuba TaxID=326968 RepID=A0A6P4ABY5_ZIZJJ|nr:pectinesterase inhibitor [Ziziphus jujuba]KAH7516962.1 hypothetical protein FEM48_Zijuj09G0011700 [Ziziphus jujuba var. spinosa]